MPDTVLSVSSFSLREQLGPIVFRFRDPSGAEQAFTLDNPKLFGLGDYPRRARDTFGIDAIETAGFQFTGLDDPEIDLFAAGLRASGTSLLNIAVDVGDLADPDPERRAADVAELKAWIARFAAMGSTFVRVNPGSPMSAHHGTEPPDQLVEALVDLGSFAVAEGTRLLVENHGGRSSDPRWLAALLDAVGTESCGLLLDLGNFDSLLKPMRARFQQIPDADDPEVAGFLAGLDLSQLYAGIEALAARAEHVSVKAHLVADDGTIGAVDLGRALRILVDHGYDGPYAVEYEGAGGDPWAKSRRVLDATREALAAARTGH
ncbi:sugar phosphate isomerase/epimerase family protein [Dactylosporangium sp. CA-233914]|uniref:sugar phosphate isomerase/epimerase family protein n=1 Tax=Dactylosporangium sp. CA-233914 TaxID=3239934 RepID=UPI003D941A2D